MIFWSFSHVDRSAFFRIFWRRRRRKSGFGSHSEAKSLRKTTPQNRKKHPKSTISIVSSKQTFGKHRFSLISYRKPKEINDFYCFLKANLWKTSIFIDFQWFPLIRGPPPYFRQFSPNGFSWISVRNRSFNQSGEESWETDSIQDSLERSPTTQRHLCIFFRF